MKKKVITKGMIMNVWSKTLDTIPHLEVRGTSHFERIVDWFESNGYNLTNNSIGNIHNYIERRRMISKEFM